MTAVPAFTPSTAEARRVLYQLVLCRGFEERVLKLVTDGSIRGTTHPYVGQEAVAVGACLVLRPQDWVISTHRGHGHLLAKGGDPNRLMAELFGKATGYGGGKGGTQHMADFAIGHLGSNGITGGGIPIGTGAALSAKLRGSGQVVVIFFGDGAANQGTFHESLNLAGLWRLPAVYVCENNLYAMSTPHREACAIEHIADRAAAYGMPGMQADGMDVQAVAAATRVAVERARAGRGPTLLECKTYRFLGHSKSDQRVYRSREEEASWRERDPIARWRALMLEHGWAGAADLDAITREALAAVDAAVEFARQSPFPAPEALTEGVFATPGESCAN
ncbi:MAG: thiamine pyrophosphate-dependent dehydrogenase E1 component subunit alpha [Deltaproteobacteria bacterium]|nr:thiamine pyrophosphate-dependent dehydrogenase E1 component subunit alpha [Deltaproteobacteria bacterium]